MKAVWFLLAVSALLASATSASAQSTQPVARVGDTYEISLTRDSAQQRGGGSSASTHDQDALIERVIAVRPDGFELEYDLPKDATAEDRAANWQFPVRVFKPLHGAPQLLNRAELEARIDHWLKEAKLTRAACGHWYFTWDAFQIQCDPQTAVDSIEPFDLRIPDLRDGAPYRDLEGKGTATLLKKASGPNGSTFTAEFQINPDFMRRAEAESDVAAAEITHKPVTFEAALQKRQQEAISGTISVTIETTPGGDVRSRTRLIKTEIRQPDGSVETGTTTETVVRRRIR